MLSSARVNQFACSRPGYTVSGVSNEMRESVLRLAAMQSRQRTCVFDLSDHYDKNRYQVMCFEMGRFIVTHPIMGSCQKC